MLNTSRWCFQVLLGHVKKSHGKRATLEISDGDKMLWAMVCAGRGQIHGVLLQKKVNGAGDPLPRRFVIEVDIIAATSLLNHAAIVGFQHLVKGDIINILMLLVISTRGVHAVGVWSCANC